MHARTHRPLRRVAVTLAAAALFAPNATAADGDNALLRNDMGHFGSQTSQPTVGPSTQAPAPTPAVVVRVDEGFDWVSAGVGAAAGAGVLLLAGGAISALRNRRRALVAPLGGH